MMLYPPYRITPEILNLAKEIGLLLGKISGSKIDRIPIHLRRSHTIQAIHASLAIEGNTLTAPQITDILDGKRVIAPPKDILEVKNALKVYEDLSKMNPLSSDDFLKAHKRLMNDLTPDAGQWRTGKVGIYKNGQIVHMPPPADRVPHLMADLFKFIQVNTESPDHTSWLLKACIFHYELEFIHPFTDGNGRMGRLWQQLLLIKENQIFEFMPTEVQIKENQEAYYTSLSASDQAGESTPFIAYSLQQIQKSLETYLSSNVGAFRDWQDRIAYAKLYFKDKPYSRKDYMVLHPEISSATASRDLAYAFENNLLKKQGHSNQTHYYFEDFSQNL